MAGGDFNVFRGEALFDLLKDILPLPRLAADFSGDGPDFRGAAVLDLWDEAVDLRGEALERLGDVSNL